MEKLYEPTRTCFSTELGMASSLTMGAPGPNYEYGPGGGRPLVHF